MLPAISRDYEGPARAIVADKYGDMGTVIIGKIESGVIRKGDNVAVMPNKVKLAKITLNVLCFQVICQVIQCWSDDLEVDQVCAGDNIKLKLKGIEEAAILPGFVVCSQDSVCHVGKIFDAELMILEHNSIIAPGYSCVLHVHAAIEEISVKVRFVVVML